MQVYNVVFDCGIHTHNESWFVSILDESENLGVWRKLKDIFFDEKNNVLLSYFSKIRLRFGNIRGV